MFLLWDHQKYLKIEGAFITGPIDTYYVFSVIFSYLETGYRLFPPVTIKPNLFPRAGYFFNAFDWDQRNSKSLIILPLSGVYSNNWLGQIN